MAVIELFTNATFADDPLSLQFGGGPDCSMCARTVSMGFVLSSHTYKLLIMALMVSSKQPLF